MRTQIAQLIFILFGLSNCYSQSVDSVEIYKDLDGFILNRNFQNQYNRELKRVRKIYPMALKAKAIIDEFEAEIAKMDKKGEVKKYSNKMIKFLKEEFSYSIRDLYVSEGRLLMQLVHRETGMTVDEIILKYAGPTQAFMYRNTAKLFNQNLRAEYEPDGANYYTEFVINDILLGLVDFNPEMDKMTKESFKESQRQYRADIKASRMRVKQRKQEKKEAEKVKKKEEKANKK